MRDLLLTRDAFDALIKSVHGTAVLGVPLRELTQRGVSERFERGALELSECGLANDGRALSLAEVVAHPQRAMLVMRDRPMLPRQHWMLYERNALVVEQTFPAPAVHRLVALDDGEREFTDRLVSSLMLTDLANPNDQMFIPQSLFQEVIRLVRVDARRGKAQELLLTAQMAAVLVDSFLEALEHPVFAVVLVFLKLSNDEAIDARELTILQGIRSMWTIHQEPVGEPRIKLAFADTARVRSIIVGFLTALA